MAKSIEITLASQLGAGSFIYVGVLIHDNGVLTTSQNYSFNANHFTCVYDSFQPNIVVFHFGANHTLSISNGDYATYSLAGTPQASPVALATSVVTDIAQYTT